jgi:hypothetical protein
MRRLNFVVPLFTLVALAMTEGFAFGHPSVPNVPTVPEPSTIVAFVGLGVMGLIGMFLQRRKRQ